MSGRRLVSLVVGLIVILLVAHVQHTRANLTGLKTKIQRNTQHASPPSSSDLDSKLAHMIESTEVIHGLQAQVSSVTRSLDNFLNEHAADANAQHLDHDQIGQILATLARLTASQKEIEERNARQIEQDHANLLQLIDTQKKQQEMLSRELEHSKNLELQLAQLRQEQEQQANQHMAAQELENSQNLEHDLAHQHADFMDDAANDGSFIETAASQKTAAAASHATSVSNGGDFNWQQEQAFPHPEHDIDLQHTMDHDQESALELHEAELGNQAAQASLPDPSRYSSSADYLAAMNSADEAEDMTPQQMEAFGQRTLGQHEVGTPSKASGLHSMSEIDSLVAEGAEEHHQADFEFHPSMLHNSKLASELSALQDEDTIQKAMLKAQAKIRAIAAELEKHNNANGGDHSEGVEIDMYSDGEMPHF